MSKIDEEQVKNIAHSVRVSLTDEEVQHYTEEITSLLGQVSCLHELNTDDVEPTTHGIVLGNVLRDDTPVKSLNQDEALKNAPDKEDGHFKVPSVID